jgi:GR25 family glycosyltransferase involved in LPS biosynthesis
MVFEDDIVMMDGISAYLRDDWIPADADIVKLETAGMLVHVSRKRLTIPFGRHLALLQSSHRGTGCYIIGRTTAERLLRVTEREGDAVDDLIFSTYRDLFERMKVYQMIPAPVAQGQNCPDFRQEGWVTTSLAERFEGRTDSREFKMDPWLARMRRRFRVRQRIRGLFQGTRFQYIPFG